jgi:DNA primase
VFDWLTLHQWGLPALALVGTRLLPGARKALERFGRLYLVLDSDEPGQAATADLVQQLGDRALPVALPGVKDVAELAERPGGQSMFTRLIAQLDYPEPEFARAA